MCRPKKLESGGTCYTGPPVTMSLLCWNCRGPGNPRAVQVLKDLVQQKKPIFIFLIETMTNKEKLERLRLNLQYEGMFSVDAVGHKGGLVLLWKHKEEAQLISYSNHHIDVIASVEV